MADILPARVFALRDLSLPFAIGTSLYVWRDQVPLSWGVCIGLGALVVLLHGTPVFEPAFVLWLSYTVFVVAYLPDGWIRRYNTLGDYSYGLYIYAFPAQQLAVHLFGPMTPWQNMAIAIPAALFCAMISWRWIEKPALAARHRVADTLAPTRE
jgi:peptidoglycan/LPS O-acetylase OafA/YrhL